MAVFDALVEAYEEENLETMAGLNPTLLDDFFLAPFTWLVRDGVSVTDGLGISPQEIYFLECLAQARPAKRIFAIGNAFGWSTLALALANPGSEVVAIDAGYDLNSLAGLEVTNRIAARLNLKVQAIEAVSPQDVGAVLNRTIGEVDLVFIDGYHTSDQVVADWHAVQPFLHPDGVALFHDVLFCNLLSGFRRIGEESGWTATLLHATTSGMGILAREYDRSLNRLTKAFAGHPGARALVHANARAAAHLRGREQLDDALSAIPAAHHSKPETPSVQ